jgi:hypothetical protein
MEQVLFEYFLTGYISSIEDVLEVYKLDPWSETAQPH